MERSARLAALGRLVLAALLVCAAGCSAPKPYVLPLVGQPDPKGLTSDPTSISMGPADSATVDASDPGYSGSFRAQSSNTTVATVTPNGPSQFLVSGANVGTCTITIKDTSGQQAVVQVSIQTVVIGGQ